MCEYTQKPRAEQKYLHPQFEDIKSEATDARALYGANMFAAVQASSNCKCRKARIYLQIEGLDGIRLLLCRGVNSICGAQATNIRRSQQCKHVCSRACLEQL